MPLEQIAGILDEDDPQLIREALRAHRVRLADASRSLDRKLERIDHLIEEGAVMPDSAGPRVIGTTLMAHDVEALRSFYHGVLGIEFFAEDHGDGVHYHATGGSFAYPDGFFLFTLWPTPDEGRDTRSELSMFVADVDVIYERALAAGGQPLEPPFDSDAFPRSAIFVDPGGNHIQIYQSS